LSLRESHGAAPPLRAQVFSTKQFIEKTADERAAILRTFSDAQIEDVETAIKAMPHFDIEYQAFVKVPHSSFRGPASRSWLTLQLCRRRATMTTSPRSCLTCAWPRRSG